MVTCTIELDGVGYCGEDIEHSYRPGYNTASWGWSCYAGDARDLPLVGGAEPKQIEGVRALQSTLEKIVTWIGDGVLTPREIKIIFR